MQPSASLQQMFEELANQFAREGEACKRDHCLVMAADTALRAGRPDQAERLRKLLLGSNPHHLLRPFSSLTEALESKDVQDYVEDLRRVWSPEAVEKLLSQSLLDESTPKNKEVYDIAKAEERKSSDAPAAKMNPQEIKTFSVPLPPLPTKDGMWDPSAPSPTSGEFGLALLLFVIGLIAAGGLLFAVFGLPLMK